MVREYTAEEKEKLESNPYTLKVSKNKFYVTVKFKEDFWIRYQAGVSPRKIIKDLDSDLVEKINRKIMERTCWTEQLNFIRSS